MDLPVLTLFGVATLDAGSERTLLVGDRPGQLLVRLACTRRWMHRDELADLLYPQHAMQDARRNLRKVLLLASRLPGVALAAKRYLAGGGLTGAIALMGPSRMEYTKVIPTLEYFSAKLCQAMTGAGKEE